jgi:hypothetical protein
LTCDIVFCIVFIVLKLNYCHKVDGRGIEWEYPDAEDLGEVDIKE